MILSILFHASSIEKHRKSCIVADEHDNADQFLGLAAELQSGLNGLSGWASTYFAFGNESHSDFQYFPLFLSLSIQFRLADIKPEKNINLFKCKISLNNM